jgi:hypothetical protein
LRSGHTIEALLERPLAANAVTTIRFPFAARGRSNYANQTEKIKI